MRLHDLHHLQISSATRARHCYLEPRREDLFLVYDLSRNHNLLGTEQATAICVLVHF